MEYSQLFLIPCGVYIGYISVLRSIIDRFAVVKNFNEKRCEYIGDRISSDRQTYGYGYMNLCLVDPICEEIEFTYPCMDFINKPGSKIIFFGSIILDSISLCFGVRSLQKIIGLSNLALKTTRYYFPDRLKKIKMLTYVYYSLLFGMSHSPDNDPYNMIIAIMIHSPFNMISHICADRYGLHMSILFHMFSNILANIKIKIKNF